MDKYNILTEVGDGAYGVVYKASDVKTGEIVAIKHMKDKFRTWKDCEDLREVKFLKRCSHQSLVRLKDVIYSKNDLYLVFEYLDLNLYQFILSRKDPIPEYQIKSFFTQILQGLVYMHKQGYYHRDLKPENLMVSSSICKITDFGLVKETDPSLIVSDYVSTRWYRAPEMLLKSEHYNTPVDIFALGCIIAELYMLRPLVPGVNEVDQLMKISKLLGTPNGYLWPEGQYLAGKIGFRFPQCLPVNFNSLLPNASYDAILLITRMLSWDPKKRPTAEQCLQDKYFNQEYGRTRDNSMANDRKYFRPTMQEEKYEGDIWKNAARVGLPATVEKGNFPMFKERENSVFPEKKRISGFESQFSVVQPKVLPNNTSFPPRFSPFSVNSFSSIGNNIIANHSIPRYRNY